MFDPMFVPPQHHPALCRFADACVPQLGKLFGNVHALHVEKQCLARLEALREHRAILSPNHPTETDPIVVFWLARMLGDRFTYLTTRESLDGPRGYLLNRIGAYSVIRGYPDRESIRYTRRLLAEEDRRVVIFPEGIVYEHNDRLFHFQSGVAQIGFWALDDLAKAGKDPRLPIVPLAIRYRCLRRPEPVMDAALRALEQALGLPGGGSLYARILAAGGRVVATLEREEGMKADESAPLSDRIARVRDRIMARVASAAGTKLDESQPTGEQLHALYNALKSWVGLPPENPTPYDRRIYAQKQAVAAPLFKELVRLNNCVAVTGDYIAAEPSAERFLEVLGRLQKEVLGRIRYQVPLGAVVRVAPPIWLDDRYGAYRENKRETVAEVTREMQETIWTMLRESAHVVTPLPSESPTGAQ